MCICIGVALVHLYFSVSFGMAHIRVLALYNVAATLFYIFHGIVTNRKKRYIQILISALAEVLFHSGMASLMLGWEWGFMTYTIAIVPVAFYLTYTLPNHEEGIVLPTVSFIVVIVWYYLIDILCRRITPLYDGGYPESMPLVFHYFNTMVTFVMLLVFSVLFALEIRYMKRRMEQENQVLEEIAKFDPLTHLLNRRSMNTYMHEVMERVKEKQETFCLIMADIDNFKRINDTYGHDCGDKVLIAVSNAISCCVRENDYVCRWGGEEILILVQADLESACKIAERICCDVASKGVSYKGQAVRFTITMGVSEYQKGTNIRAMIEKADQNLYHGKVNGKNQVVR